MARTQTEWGKYREQLVDSLDKLKKYGTDPEWKELPGYEQRVQKHTDLARIAFSNLLGLLGIKGKASLDDKEE